jgi:hypothetical protein
VIAVRAITQIHLRRPPGMDGLPGGDIQWQQSRRSVGVGPVEVPVEQRLGESAEPIAIRAQGCPRFRRAFVDVRTSTSPVSEWPVQPVRRRSRSHCGGSEEVIDAADASSNLASASVCS